MENFSDENIIKSFGKMLTQLREKSGFPTQRQLALQSKISPATISRIEAGIQKAEPKTLAKLAPYLKISYEELLQMSGYLPEPADDHDVSFGFIYPSFEIVSIPVLGTIKAGIPVLANGNWEGQVPAPADLNADFALRIMGDSMSWVGIHEGDLAFLRKIETPSHGMIVAAGVEDVEWSATLKFYVKENGKIFLRAANPAYEDILVGPEHRIIGQVVSIQKEPPSLQVYKHHLVVKETLDSGWDDAIEKAASHGMDGEKVKKLIELFSHMVKNV